MDNEALSGSFMHLLMAAQYVPFDEGTIKKQYSTASTSLFSFSLLIPVSVIIFTPSIRDTSDPYILLVSCRA